MGGIPKINKSAVTGTGITGSLEVIIESSLIGVVAGVALAILIFFASPNKGSGILVKEVFAVFAMLPGWFILAYEFADMKWLKDVDNKFYDELGWKESVMLFAGITVGTILFLNLVYMELPLVPLVIVGAIVGAYIATPNTGDDYFLFMAWVACSIIAMGMGWISPAAWAAYQVVIPAKIGALTGNKPISINPINIPINLPW